MLTAILFSLFTSTAYAHQSHHVRKHQHHVHQHQHHYNRAHAPRGHVWVENRGWTPRYMVRWVPGHYVGRGHHRHWVSGKFVIRVR